MGFLAVYFKQFSAFSTRIGRNVVELGEGCLSKLDAFSVECPEPLFPLSYSCASPRFLPLSSSPRDLSIGLEEKSLEGTHRGPHNLLSASLCEKAAFGQVPEFGPELKRG